MTEAIRGGGNAPGIRRAYEYRKEGGERFLLWRSGTEKEHAALSDIAPMTSLSVLALARDLGRTSDKTFSQWQFAGILDREKCRTIIATWRPLQWPAPPTNRQKHHCRRYSNSLIHTKLLTTSSSIPSTSEPQSTASEGSMRNTPQAPIDRSHPRQWVNHRAPVAHPGGLPMKL